MLAVEMQFSVLLFALLLITRSRLTDRHRIAGCHHPVKLVLNVTWRLMEPDQPSATPRADRTTRPARNVTRRRWPGGTVTTRHTRQPMTRRDDNGETTREINHKGGPCAFSVCQILS